MFIGDEGLLERIMQTVKTFSANLSLLFYGQSTIKTEVEPLRNCDISNYLQVLCLSEGGGC